MLNKGTNTVKVKRVKVKSRAHLFWTLQVADIPKVMVIEPTPALLALVMMDQCYPTDR